MRTTLLCLLATSALAACSGSIGDPYSRPGTWIPEHNNDSNLRAMVADPADLQRGHGDNIAIGATAAAAVDRLMNDKVKPLPATGVAEVKLNSSGTTAGAGGQ